MATTRQNRLQVGSGPWVLEERKSALQIAGTEAEEFSFSARNELEWLNEHMADIFNENHVNVAEIFKTPGKLRGKTPRTVRKANLLETRPPLSDVFSATPRGLPSPFRQAQFERPVATFQVAEDESSEPEQPIVQHPAPRESPMQRKPVPNYFDSGYFGSQSQNTHATHAIEAADTQATIPYSPPKIASPEPALVQDKQVMDRDSGGSFQSAKEELPKSVPGTEEMDIDAENFKPMTNLEASIHPVLESPFQTRHQQSPPPKRFQQNSPQRSPQNISDHPEQPLSSPQRSSSQRVTPKSPQRSPQHLQGKPVAELASSPPSLANVDPVEEAASFIVDEQMEDVHSPSDGSSPIRPIVRKSSLNFASLPAREPLTSKKSLGERTSRNHLEQTRTSYYGRTTGGKSLGNSRQEEHASNEDEMDIDIDDDDTVTQEADSKIARLHNKTSTQRLQDQISMLGQSQSHARPASKSIAGNVPPASQNSQIPSAPAEPIQRQKSPQRSPERKSRPPPGAFPEDEEDSWIGPPTVPQNGASVFSPRPQLPKSHTADVMEGIHDKESIAGPQFNIPKRGEYQRQRSPIREPVIPERTTSTLGHLKSASTSVLRSPKKADEAPILQKAISVSNPNPFIGSNGTQTTPPKSPSRSYRGSPLKAAKDKFSSILKTSRGLFASSAAVSAEAKTSALSPPSTRSGMHQGPSFEDVLSHSSDKAPLYPILDNESSEQVNSIQRAASPPKTNGRKTRASTEREERRKEEEAREAKEAQRMDSQLEKARSKVKEEARVFHKQQERVAAMQKEVEARKEQEIQAKASQADLPRTTRSSPRKTKAQLEAEGVSAAASADDISSRDVEMSDASAMPPPAAIPRPKSQIGRPGPKRPLKPAKNTLARPQPPTVIRVDTGSQRGHQYHPSTSTLSATLQESLSAPSGPPGLRKKASTSSIQSKASTSSFKATANKALEAAARKKEQDEMVAQRKREAKQEIERQRAALKEEERRKDEQQRRQEAERQREIQRERERAAVAADAKKSASRQAAEKRRQELEKAKQTRAPPPAAHHLQDKALPPIPRGEHNNAKPTRNDLNAHRQHEEQPKVQSQASHNVTKFAPKRPLQEEFDDHSRPALQRNGPSYQTEGHSKRRKTSERFDDDGELTENQPTINAPPIRRTSSKPKEMQPKSLFPSGYANAPSSNNLQRSTIISQHNMNQLKSAHPMDMAQMSKGPIAFAPNPNQSKPQQHKTPVRPVDIKANAKSAAKSSPQYQNGENIDLPEIMTDSDDDDEEEGPGKPSFTAPWVESPALRKQLTEQENIDPNEIFGQPGPINMEEVFNKSKDKFKKFRSRTSSANWGGIDRLTEDEIKKDLAARQRMQRAGGWEYSSMI